jgi:hypothetical protein
MSFCIKMLKCCTDKVVNIMNCILLPPASLLLIGKTYAFPTIRDYSWYYISAPIASIVAFDIVYYTCCEWIEYRQEQTERHKLLKSIEIIQISNKV